MGNAMYRKQVKKYQSWTGYPDSPVLSGDYPYQSLIWAGGFIRLYCSSAPIKMDAGNDAFQSDETVVDGHYLLWQYNLSGATWVYNTDGWLGMWITIIDQANHDVCEQDGVTVYFTKTTTTEQDGGSTTSLIRIRNLHHKTSVSLPTQGWTGYPSTPDGLDSYVHQCVARANQLDQIPVDTIYLFVSTGRLYDFVDPPYSALICENSFVAKTYSLVAGVWQFLADSNSGNTLLSPFYILECNTPIYSDNSFTTILYPKTTTTAQDNNETSVTFLIRDKAAFWKDGATLHRINI